MGTSTAHVLAFSSRRANRVTKSTLGAEAVAQTCGMEEAMKYAAMIEEMENPGLSTEELFKMQLQGGHSLPIDVVTDCKSLYEVKASAVEPRPADATATLWLRWLREAHQSNVARRNLWCCTSDMLADALTKPMSGEVLLRLLGDGSYHGQYAMICNGGVVDGYKGRPPTKKEKSGGEDVVESVLNAYYTCEWL